MMIKRKRFSQIRRFKKILTKKVVLIGGQRFTQLKTGVCK